MIRCSLAVVPIGASLLVLGTVPTRVRAQAGTNGSVTGTVYDSVARAPLANADVQLVPVDRANGAHVATARTDDAGRFRADSVQPGAYRVGFFHPAVDSLGVTVPIRVVDVRGSATRVDLATPSPTTIAAAVCGPLAGDSLTTVIGFVRDASGATPRADAEVRVTWSDLVLDASGVRAAPQQRQARTLPTGWFAVCAVPFGAVVGVRAVAGADTSGAQELDVGNRTLVHHDLALGGVGSVRGTVVSAAGRPISHAIVALVGRRDTTTTNDAGTFTLARVAAGSQTLDVRAVGYVPVRTAITIGAGEAATDARVSLVSMRNYLDTVRVLGKNADLIDPTGFERRRRASGTGYFMTSAEIDRVRAFTMPELLRWVPGLDAVRTRNGQQIVSRARGRVCRPLVYIDGQLLPGSTGGTIAELGVGDMLDSYQPDEIAGVEFYPSAAATPSNLVRQDTNCGAIVLWTHRTMPAAEKKP